MKVWIPRTLRDDGMIMTHECHGHHQCEHTYIRVDDHIAALAEKDSEITRLHEQIEKILRHKDRLEREYRGYGTPEEECHKKAQRLAEKERDYKQLKEAYDAVSAGKPLGPVVGAQTIVNQALLIKQLQADLDQVLGEAMLNAEANKFFYENEEWGSWLAWIVEGAPTRDEGIKAAKRIVTEMTKLAAREELVLVSSLVQSWQARRQEGKG